MYPFQISVDINLIFYFSVNKYYTVYLTKIVSAFEIVTSVKCEYSVSIRGSFTVFE